MNKELLFFFGLFMTGLCLANVITVDDDGVADFNNIQEAVDYSIHGDVIIVMPGFYGEDVNFAGKNVILTSTNPSDSNIVASTIIGYDYNTLSFQGTENSDCVLTGFDINSIIYGNHTHAVISNCTLQGNEGSCGSVIFSCDGLIKNCLIVDNGGAFCACICPTVDYCHGSIRNCTIESNVSGVAIGVGENSFTEIENCILVGGGYPEGFPQIMVEPGGTAKVSFSYLVQMLDGQQGIDWGPGNIDLDPCFADPCNGDYHLKSEGWRWDINTDQWTWDDVTSRCIDAGNPGCDPADEPMPNSRNRINMGAYGGTTEASIPPHNWALLADLTNDGIVNFEDYAEQSIDWSNNEDCQPGDLNRDGVINIADFILLIDEWLDETLWH